jgi:hypothetical protein
MKLHLFAAVVLAGALFPAIASAYVSSEGHVYRAVFNANGIVFRSEFPVARFTGYGAGTSIRRSIELIYLGKRCDLFSPLLGSGRWGWANGGIMLTFSSGREIAFGRQELDDRQAKRFGWSIDRCRF